MKAKRRSRKRAAAILAVGLITGTTGCGQDSAAQLASTSGTFLGDVVSILATRYLELTLGVEGKPPAEEHTHDHSATPLHEHEH